MLTQGVQKHPEISRLPLMELPVVGFVLAFVSGTLDAWTLTNADTFATVQSGNLVSSGYWLAQANWDKLGFPLASVLSFGIGASVGGVIMTTLLRKRTSFTGRILLMEAVILVVLAIIVLSTNVDARYIALGVSFVAGAQGNAFHRIRGTVYGNVAVTLVIQRAFNFLTQSILARKGTNHERDLMASRIMFLVLLGFGGGGAIGALATRAWGGWALFMPAGLLLSSGLIAHSQALRNLNPDPTPDAPIV